MAKLADKIRTALLKVYGEEEVEMFNNYLKSMSITRERMRKQIQTSKRITRSIAKVADDLNESIASTSSGDSPDENWDKMERFILSKYKNIPSKRKLTYESDSDVESTSDVKRQKAVETEKVQNLEESEECEESSDSETEAEYAESEEILDSDVEEV